MLLPGSESIGKLDAYAKGHLFQLYGESAELKAILDKIALAHGVSSEDM
jgi:hypothetical protein